MFLKVLTCTRSSGAKSHGNVDSVHVATLLGCCPGPPVGGKSQETNAVGGLENLQQETHYSFKLAVTHVSQVRV